jgi:molybdopterin-guanine dinucleotide biosynthesis protein A
MTSVEAFILAGGRSSRFGSDKALMTIEGKPVIQMIADVVAEAISDSRTTVVTAGPTQLFTTGFSLPFVFDLYPGRGPWSGLQAALAYCRSEWAMILACDQPFITSEIIRYLFQRASDEYDAVVPTQADGRPQPLCAFYRRSTCLPIVEDVVISKRSTPPLRTIVEKIRTREISFDELRGLPGSECFFTNINTPTDLEGIS